MSKQEKLQNLFKTEEEELKEKGPIFKFIRKEQEEDGSEVEKEYVSVAGIELEVNKEGQGTEFTGESLKTLLKRFAVDKKSFELVKSMAMSIKLGQPLLNEGPTDIGKSLALEYLSYLTNNHLIYMSFSGQTDVMDLVGKYVPATEDARVRFEKLLMNRKNWSEKTKEIFGKYANSSERFSLTLEECRQIAENEKMVDAEDLKKLQWSWSDGELARQFKFDKGRGCWSYFDELGAAEPQVLVKINRIFSHGLKKITITENSEHPTIEAIYPEWHPKAGRPNRFTLTATTNPPSYAGRVPFEKDFLRRWNYQRSGALDKETFLARLDFIGHEEKAVMPEIKYYKKPESYIDLRKNSDLDHLINLFIAEFAMKAQMQLDAWHWEQGEQEFRFDDFSTANRVQEYVQKLQSDDLLETLKDAIRYYYMGKIQANLKFYFKNVSDEEFEGHQESRVKELETLMNETLNGPTGPKIKYGNTDLSLEDAIKEEIKKIDANYAVKSLERENGELLDTLKGSDLFKDIDI